MSAVGIATIVIGVLALCGRFPLIVAPAATLRWWEGVISRNGRIRALGGFLLVLGVATVWVGSSEGSGLATLLSVLGWAWMVIGALVMAIPGGLRAVMMRFLPADSSGRLTGWRLRGVLGVVFGLVLIYFGVLAL